MLWLFYRKKRKKKVENRKEGACATIEPSTIKELILTATADMANMFLSNKESCGGEFGVFGTYEQRIMDFNENRTREPTDPHSYGGRMCNVCHASKTVPICFTEDNHRGNGRSIKKSCIECYLIKILEKKHTTGLWGIIKCTIHPFLRYLIWHEVFISSSISFKFRFIDRFIVNACKRLYSEKGTITKIQKARCVDAMEHLLSCQTPFMGAARAMLLKIDLSRDWDITLRARFLGLEAMEECNDCAECNLELYL